MKNITSIDRRLFIGSVLAGAGLALVGCGGQNSNSASGSAIPSAEVTDGQVLIHTFPTVSEDQVELGSKEVDTSGEYFNPQTYNDRYHFRDIKAVQFINIDASATSYLSGSHIGEVPPTDQEAFKKSYFYKPSPDYRKPLRTDSMASTVEIMNIAWANAYDTEGNISQSSQIFFQPLGSVVLRVLGFEPSTQKAIVATYVIEERFITDSFDEVVADYPMMDMGTMNQMRLDTPPSFRVVAGAGRLTMSGEFDQYVVTTARYVGGEF